MLRGRVRTIRIGRARLQVEVADTMLTRAIGLMFRRRLAPGAGVLLRFSRPGNHALHMWWVRMPLDIVFIDRRGIVVGIRHAVPGEGPFTPGRPVRDVLEVIADTCRRCGITVGNRLAFSASR